MIRHNPTQEAPGDRETIVPYQWIRMILIFPRMQETNSISRARNRISLHFHLFPNVSYLALWACQYRAGFYLVHGRGILFRFCSADAWRAGGHTAFRSKVLFPPEFPRANEVQHEVDMNMFCPPKIGSYHLRGRDNAFTPFSIKIMLMFRELYILSPFPPNLCQPFPA